jgi:hypothetical protein
VWRRHLDCNCIITTVTERGKKDIVENYRLSEKKRRERIDTRKAVEGVQRPEPTQEKLAERVAVRGLAGQRNPFAFDLQLFSVKSEKERNDKVNAFLGALNSGAINIKVRWAKQREHMPGTVERKRREIQDKSKTGNPSSVFFEDIDIKALVN